MIQVEVYKQERNVLAGQLAGSSYATVAVGTMVFIHLCDSNGNYKIDITDIVRTMPSAILDVTYYDSGGTVIEQEQYELQVKGLINPHKAFAPPTPVTDYTALSMAAYLQSGDLILPPSRIIIGAGLRLELYQDNALPLPLQADCIYKDMDGVQQTAALTIDGNTLYYGMMGLGYYPEQIYIWNWADIRYGIIAQLPVCGIQYARVEWISRLGTLKAALWEVEKRTDAQADTYSLWDMQNAYDYHTGREERMTLVQRNLNAYDYWYWSDIVTSSDVRVSLDMVAVDLPQSARVQVTTKEVIMPDGNGGKSTLKVNVNFRRYDAI